MIIKKLKVKNYRTLEEVEIVFDGYYTAISGKNNGSVEKRWGNFLN